MTFYVLPPPLRPSPLPPSCEEEEFLSLGMGIANCKHLTLSGCDWQQFIVTYSYKPGEIQCPMGASLGNEQMTTLGLWEQTPWAHFSLSEAGRDLGALAQE
jgi:hypothetical protein